MKIFRKLFAVIISFVLAFSSVSAFAANGDLYIMGDPVFIDGVRQPTSLGLFVSFSADKVNLSNTSLSSYLNIIEATGDFTLTLNGNNTLTSRAPYALKVVGSLTISGDGDLTAKAKKAAIYVEGDVTISGGGTLALTGTDAESYGIYATGEITVTDSEVIASGSKENIVSNGGPLSDLPQKEDENKDPEIPENNGTENEGTENEGSENEGTENENTENNETNEETSSEEKPSKPSGKPSIGGTPGKLPPVSEENKDNQSQIPAKSEFSDVLVNDWFCVYVNTLVSEGVVNGYPDKTFKPQGKVTYGEALKLVARAAGLSEQTPTSEHWASGYLALASSAGVLPADQNLDESITRKVIALLSKTFLNLPAPKNPSPFADIDDAAITSLYEAGIVEGSFADNGDRVYLPDSYITRAEISAIVYRMLK